MLNDDDRTASYRKQQDSKFSQMGQMLGLAKGKILTFALSKIRTGPETVVLVPPVARGGNWLYEWMRAQEEAEKRQAPAFLLETPGMEAWLQEFPALKSYTRPPQALRFRSRRLIGFSQKIEESFSKEELRSFIERNLFSESFCYRQKKARSLVQENTLVVNIRRGDYYSLDTIHRLFGIDTVAYVRAALNLALEKGKPSNIVVTSDDLDWCAQNLAFLDEVAPTRFEKFGEGMFDDLAVLSVSRRLILTNTTFGYWGAYMANLNYDAEIYAPNIHQDLKNTSFADRTMPIQHQRNWVQVPPPSGWSSWLEVDRPDDKQQV